MWRHDPHSLNPKFSCSHIEIVIISYLLFCMWLHFQYVGQDLLKTVRECDVFPLERFKNLLNWELIF
jgi:predicted transcriptional regulator